MSSVWINRLVFIAFGWEGRLELFFSVCQPIGGGGFDRCGHLLQDRTGFLGEVLGCLTDIVAQVSDPFTLPQFLSLLVPFLGRLAQSLYGMARQFLGLLGLGAANNRLQIGLGFLPQVARGMEHRNWGLDQSLRSKCILSP